MRAPLLILAAGLAGCMSNPQNVANHMAKQGQPPAYAQGYGDGCVSGQSAGGYLYATFTKDVARFNEDKLYAQGWTDGFNVCKGQQEDMSRTLNDVL